MKLEDLVTVIVRSVGERTEGLCCSLIKEQIPEDNIHLISEGPFYKTLEATFKTALRENRKWTLCLDADVLIRPSFIKDIIEYAEGRPADVVEINAVAIDKFLLSPREVGQRLYRTQALEQAILYVDAAKEEIRPETFIVNQLLKEGFHQDRIDLLVGIHDYEQSYKDIYRKIFVHTKKHQAAGIAADYKLWKQRQLYDNDYKVAVAAYEASLKYTGKVLITCNADFLSDAEAVIAKLKLVEKRNLLADDKSATACLNQILMRSMLTSKKAEKLNPSLHRLLQTGSSWKSIRRWFVQVKIRDGKKRVRFLGRDYLNDFN